MRFGTRELLHLDGMLLARAKRVVPMRDIYKGDTDPLVIGLRHDVDDNPGSFDTALEMARWEFERGYSSTYFLLHGSHYWDTDNLVRALELEELGHEVGIHVNAIAESLRLRETPEWILLHALADLREVGLRIDGCVAHGDSLCRNHKGQVTFVNDEMFAESPRPEMGEPDRLVRRNGIKVQLDPQPRAAYDLCYDANWLPRGDYLSDSGGQWSQPLQRVAATFGMGQLHMLVHPDHWVGAFDRAVA